MRHILIAAVLPLFITITVAAQRVKSDPLYWVVETNTNNPSYSIVKFYDRFDLLVHEVRLDGVHIDIRVAKHKKKLDQLLKTFTDRNVPSAKRNKSRRSI